LSVIIKINKHSVKVPGKLLDSPAPRFKDGVLIHSGTVMAAPNCGILVSVGAVFNREFESQTKVRAEEQKILEETIAAERQEFRDRLAALHAANEDGYTLMKKMRAAAKRELQALMQPPSEEGIQTVQVVQTVAGPAVEKKVAKPRLNYEVERRKIEDLYSRNKLNGLERDLAYRALEREVAVA